MKYFDWDISKNEKLLDEREISFEDILVALSGNNLIDILRHSNVKKYPNQKVFVVRVSGYVYLVPFVEDEEKIFLKTIIPSRKATKKYLINKQKKKR